MSRRRLRKTKRIVAKLDQLAEVDLDQFQYDQIDLITRHIDRIDAVGQLIDDGGYGHEALWRYMNRLYGQAVRRRLDLEDAAGWMPAEVSLN